MFQHSLWISTIYLGDVVVFIIYSYLEVCGIEDLHYIDWWNGVELVID